jgi:hypothetical protein
MVNARLAYQTNSQSYTGVNITTLGSAEPALNFTTSSSTAQWIISMSVSKDGNGIVLATLSQTGNCWYEIDNPKAISTTNSANTTAPYGATATASNTPGSATARSLVLPTTAATTYGEAKGDGIAGDCSASAPKLTGAGTVWQTSTAKLPS